MTTTDPTPLPDHDDYVDDPKIRPWLVHASIFVAFALFFSLVLLLYYRWSTMHVPTSSLTVAGDERLAGYQVDLHPVSPDAPMSNIPLKQKLEAANKFVARFSVVPGMYEIQVSNDEKQLLNYSIKMRDGIGWKVDLPHALNLPPLPDSASTTRPGENP